jgi:Cell wall-active antibiotics response 4TMS YvqF
MATHQPSSRPALREPARWQRRTSGHGRVLDLGRLLLGLTVLALGVLFLLDSAGALNANRTIDRWWPLVIVVGGVFTLAERPPSVRRGALLSGAGLLLLLFTTDVLEQDAWSYVWPGLLVLAGLVIIARWRGQMIFAGGSTEHAVRSTAIFGGHKLVSTSQRFQGAWLTAIFGGLSLDLRDARPSPDGAPVNATVAFGGIDILVPRGWRISVRSTPIFGGIEDKTDHSQPPPDDAPTIHVDAVALFGGVNIKNEK